MYPFFILILINMAQIRKFQNAGKLPASLQIKTPTGDLDPDQILKDLYLNSDSLYALTGAPDKYKAQAISRAT